MKKTLLFLLTFVCSLIASAETIVTFDNTVAGWSSNAGAQTATLNGVTISTGNGLLASTGEYRFYKSQTATISSTVGNIVKIEFTCTANGTTKYGPGCFTIESGNGEYNYSANIGTWTGSSTEVVLKATADQVRATQIVVTISSDAPAFPTPTITPGTGVYTEPQDVTITTAEGLGIIYTLDGSTPEDGNGTAVTTNTVSFKVEKSTTVKAITYDIADPDNHSSVATSVISIPVKKTIAEVHAEGAGNDVIINGNIVATADGGFVIADETGLLYTYKSGHGLAVGDVVTLMGKTTTYGGFVQLSSDANIEKTGTTTISYPTPVIMDAATLDAWVEAPVQQYAQVKGKLTISENYYNVTVEGTTAMVSFVKPNAEILKTLVTDTDITLTGYTMYTTSATNTGIKYAYFVATDVVTETVLPEIVPMTISEFTNGGFEAWTEGTPDQWTPKTSSTNATIKQSEIAHTGSYSLYIEGDNSGTNAANKRVSSSEIALTAGKYVIELSAKAVGETAKVRPGYLVLTLNEAKTAYNKLESTDYKYPNAAVDVTAEWTSVKTIFDLEEDTIISLLVMNPKNAGDVLVDDVIIRAATAEEIEADGINNITTNANNSRAYNIHGQQISNSYKGIMIINGKKLIKK